MEIWHAIDDQLIKEIFFIVQRSDYLIFLTKIFAVWALPLLFISLTLLALKKHWLCFISSTFAVGLTWIVSQIISFFVDRPRPFIEFPDFVNPTINYPTDSSMPSDHAATAFAAATVLSLFFKKTSIIVTTQIVAVLIALARVAAGVHYPSDVIVGGAVGVVTALVWIIATKNISEKLEKKWPL